MARTKSADEVRAEHLAAMGSDLGEVFTVLSNELTLLSWQFQQLSELYGGDGKRHEVMNRAAPFFFWLLQRSWWDESLLGITRLVAPKESLGKKNLTFQQLPDLIGDPTLKASIDANVQGVVKRAAFAKAWRDKRIAHRDLDHSLDRAPAPLPPATHADVAAVLRDLATILNDVQAHYLKSTTIYEKAPITHGVMDLLYVVRDGLRREELRQERLEKHGEYRPEEWDDDAPPL